MRPGLLERIDRIAAELAELRAEVQNWTAEGAEPTEDDGCSVQNGTAVDDLAPEHLIDTTSAQERFGIPRNTLALWCRTEGLGVRRGGRWLISIGRLQKHVNGK